MRTAPRTIALAMIAATASLAGAQATTRLSIAPSSKLWVEGTSNIHDWKCETQSFDAAIDVDGLAAQFATAAPKALKKVTIKVPVKTLKCGHGKMDDNMYKALKADENADIVYALGTFEVVPGENAGDFTLRTVGTLTIAGKEQPVNMDVIASRSADGTVKATGTVPVKMTAFGVKPPTAIFGTIKAGDEVKVKFEINVSPKVISQAMTPPM